MSRNEARDLMSFLPGATAPKMEILKHKFAGRQIANCVSEEREGLLGARTGLCFGNLTGGSSCMKAALEIPTETPR